MHRMVTFSTLTITSSNNALVELGHKFSEVTKYYCLFCVQSDSEHLKNVVRIVLTTRWVGDHENSA